MSSRQPQNQAGMRSRYKGPSGTGILELPDTATIYDVFEELKLKTGISAFSLRYGPPMAMKNLTLEQRDQTARSLGLHGDTLTIVPDEARLVSPIQQPPTSTSDVPTGTAQRLSESKPKNGPDDINIPWPARQGTLSMSYTQNFITHFVTLAADIVIKVVRVMPSDNSCLFTAFGGALPKQIPAQDLRCMMAEHIMAHPNVFSAAVLSCSPAEYCRSIQDPDRWGGGIELSILSSIFDIQICTFDVQTQNVINFGENKSHRCILIYSGIHYDRVAFTYSEYPHTQTVHLPPECDCTTWPTTDDEILAQTHQLIQKLHSAHYYTDTDGLILKCNAPGCQWIGSGQAEGRKHAMDTGHTDLSEIEDTDDAQNPLMACGVFRCDFMGQGVRALKKHTDDTGHNDFHVIPDGF